MNRACFSLLFVALLAGCREKQATGLPPPAAERIAIFPIENLTGRAEWQAATVALPLLLEYQLTGLPDIAPILVDSSSQAAHENTTRELRGYLEESGGSISVRLQDRHGAILDRTLTAAGGTVAALSEQLASQIATNRRKLPNLSDGAISTFAAGLTASNRSAAAERFAATVQQAKSFGPAWLELGSALWNAGGQQQAVQAWQSALAEPSLDALSKARIRAELTNRTNSPDRPAALAEIAKLLPANATAQAQAGQAQLDLRNFREGARHLGRAVALQPANGDFRNLLAYAQGWAGEVEAAMETLSAYEQVEPHNPNALDSRGEILFYDRRFKDAGRAFESVFGADPNFQQSFTLRKAAEAYLLAGDTSSADRVMQQLTGLPQFAASAERMRAAWSFRKTGDRRAIEKLTELGKSDPNAAAQAAIWLIQSGDRVAALKLAETLSGPLSLVLRFVGQPSAPAAVWLQRAQALAADAKLRHSALIFALALDQHWAELAQTMQADEPISPLRSAPNLALYRKALVKSGNQAKLASVPDWPALPAFGAEGLFDSLLFRD